MTAATPPAASVEPVVVLEELLDRIADLRGSTVAERRRFRAAVRAGIMALDATAAAGGQREGAPFPDRTWPWRREDDGDPEAEAVRIERVRPGAEPEAWDQARAASRAAIEAMPTRPGFGATIPVTWGSTPGATAAGGVAAAREALDVGLNVLVACVKPAGGCDDERDIAHAITVMQAALALPTPGAGGQSYQARVNAWMLACFGEAITADRTERSHRFLEEALELVQASGCTAGEAHQLVDYVFGRDTGEVHQEVGGVMVCLAALCTTHGIDLAEAGEAELRRVWTKVEQIRAKHAAKPQFSPLPGTAPGATP